MGIAHDPHGFDRHHRRGDHRAQRGQQARLTRSGAFDNLDQDRHLDERVIAELVVDLAGGCHSDSSTGKTDAPARFIARACLDNRLVKILAVVASVAADVNREQAARRSESWSCRHECTNSRNGDLVGRAGIARPWEPSQLAAQRRPQNDRRESRRQAADHVGQAEPPLAPLPERQRLQT